MSRYIDADALIEKLGIAKECNDCKHNKEPYCGWKPDVVDICEAINDAPTIDERKKGKWIKKMRVTETEKYTSYDPDWHCACCGTKYAPNIARMVNFCYVCGVDMRGEQDALNKC